MGKVWESICGFYKYPAEGFSAKIKKCIFVFSTTITTLRFNDPRLQRSRYTGRHDTIAFSGNSQQSPEGPHAKYARSPAEHLLGYERLCGVGRGLWLQRPHPAPSHHRRQRPYRHAPRQEAEGKADGTLAQKER